MPKDNFFSLDQKQVTIEDFRFIKLYTDFIINKINGTQTKQNIKRGIELYLEELFYDFINAWGNTHKIPSVFLQELEENFGEVYGQQFIGRIIGASIPKSKSLIIDIETLADDMDSIKKKISEYSNKKVK